MTKTIATGNDAREFASNMLGKSLGARVARVDVEPMDAVQTGPLIVGDVMTFYFEDEPKSAIKDVKVSVRGISGAPQ